MELHLLLILSCTLRCVLGYSVSWNMMSVIVKSGQDLELVCTATGVMTSDLMRITKTTNDGSYIRVADSDGFSDVYRGHARYEFTFQQLGTVAILTLRFKGIQPEDSGIYRCFKLRMPDAPDAALSIQVNVPLSVFYLASEGPSGERRHGEGDVLNFNERTALKCRATISRSGTPPLMWIRIGGDDVTDHFLLSSWNESVSTYGGPTRWRSETNMVYDTEQVYNTSYNDRRLVCFAQAEGYEPSSTFVLLNFTYGPRIHCGELKRFVSLGEPFAVSCNVSMNPFGGIFYLGARVPGLHQQTMPFDSGGRVVTSLYSPSVQESMYKNYTLVATNSVGTERVTFVVGPMPDIIGDLRGHSTRLRPNQATPGVCLLLLLFILLY